MENIKDVTPEIAARFSTKLDKAAQNGCWNWTGAKTPYGYGKLQYRRKGEFIYAHRLSLLIEGKQPFKGAVAMHACDNPSCANPAHLSWGTQKENTRQSIRSGRSPHSGRAAGEKNGNARLSEQDVIEIRRSQESIRELANRFKIGLSTVREVRAGRRWKHVCTGEALASTLSAGN